MNIHEAFPGKFLKAEDFDDGPKTFTIDAVVKEEVRDEIKNVMSFANCESKFVLNKTNFQSIVDLLGLPNSNDWRGKPLTLMKDMTDFGGKRVDCIRVSAGSLEEVPF